MSYPFSKVNSKQTAPANRVEAHTARGVTKSTRFGWVREKLFSRMGLVSKKPLAMTKAPSAITPKSVGAEGEVSSSLKNDKAQKEAAVQYKSYLAEVKERSAKAEALFFSKYQELKNKLVDIMSGIVERDSPDVRVVESEFDAVEIEEVNARLNGIPWGERLKIERELSEAKKSLLASFYYKEDANVFDYSVEFRSEVIEVLKEKFESSDNKRRTLHINSLQWAKKNVHKLDFFERTIDIIDKEQKEIGHKLTPKQQKQRGVIKIVADNLKRIDRRPNQSLYELYHGI
ncbi:hypothetical protein ACJJI3_03210 [Microbulbifer sp. ZKSA004]|uniref:hypothetical protein n=1 Tax=Microbulbifer sp. ZKSA004 TaxID=3243389 RepID=UPI00403A5D1E